MLVALLVTEELNHSVHSPLLLVCEGKDTKKMICKYINKEKVTNSVVNLPLFNITRILVYLQKPPSLILLLDESIP